VVSARESDAQAAPAGLEPVRALLNSWLIPNDSRHPADRFGELARQQRWTEHEAASVRELRDDLRRLIESGSTAEAGCLNAWIDRLAVRPAVADGQVSYWHAGGPAGALVAAVLSAISAGTWKRLKACPDCRWVFYDHTRNGSKRWCLMYAGGPDGRACGTIAKVRRYREKQRG
jgi:predicted RNA-binding Zn ribbon-like protein